MCYGSGMLEIAKLNRAWAAAVWLAAVMETLALTAAAQPRTKAATSPLRNSRQVLVVVTDSWQSFQGTLRRYERTGLNSRWRPVGPGFPVVVGKQGLAWASGLRGGTSGDPVKHEGDQKAPAGAFRLGTAFGRPATSMPGLRMPYLSLGSNVECVDDAASSYYNQLISRDQVSRPDWTSSEKMWTEPLYKYGVVVHYNTSNATPGAGSCIFLHIWNGPQSGTAGCTAMDESNLTGTMRWLDPKKNPVLVQLPQSEYERLKSHWRLP